MAPSAGANGGRARSTHPLKAFWRRIRKPLARSRFAKNALASLLSCAVRFVGATNTRVAGSHDMDRAIDEHTPAIAALWHGQHLLAPVFNPRRSPLVALFSRSADAELNALVAERFGIDVVRGSGGRAGATVASKGGARALLALKKVIAGGRNVAMIADIPHGTPRQAGIGIVTLARISGRPIVPMAIATSRRKVLEKSWDRTTINLPFGRSSLILGDPIFVAADADEQALEEKRREVTAALDAATREAYRLVDETR